MAKMHSILNKARNLVLSKRLVSVDANTTRTKMPTTYQKCDLEISAPKSSGVTAQNQQKPHAGMTHPSGQGELNLRRTSTLPPLYDVAVQTTSTPTTMRKQLLKIVADTYSNLYLRDSQLSTHLDSLGFTTRDARVALDDIDIDISKLNQRLRRLERILKLAARALDSQPGDLECIAQLHDGLHGAARSIIELVSDARSIAVGVCKSNKDPEHRQVLREYWLERDFIPAVRQLKPVLRLLHANVESAYIIARQAYAVRRQEVHSGIKGLFDTSGVPEYKPDLGFVYGIGLRC